MSDDSSSLSVSATSVLRLIQAHLTQSGLHATAAALRDESGVGMAAPLHSQWLSWTTAGEWHLVLQSLATIDMGNDDNTRLIDLMAAVHEHIILEVAQAGDLALAYALLRLADTHLQASNVYDDRTDQRLSVARRVEISLQEIDSRRQKQQKLQHSSPSEQESEIYPGGVSRDERRRVLGQTLLETFTVQPPDRLLQLLQQAVKYQAWTGQLPEIQQLWENDNDDDEDKVKRKKRKRKVFDLVLGTVDAKARRGGASSTTPQPTEPYSFHKVLTTVKFGKNVVCEAAVYTPDGGRLVTASSDGLIDVWSTSGSDYASIVIDEDTTMGHADAVLALTVSRDGTLLASGTVTGQVTVWRLDSGKALRQFTFGDNIPIHTLQFGPDASRLLVVGGPYCREYGLRTSQCLREYGRADVSLVTAGYHFSQARVWTAATDGRIRWYDARTAAPLSAWCILDGRRTTVGTSIVVDDGGTATADDAISSVPAVVAFLHAPTRSQSNTWILAPRADQAYLVDDDGILIRVLSDSSSVTSGASLCAAATSPNGAWLYGVRENGTCTIWQTATGVVEANVSSVGTETIKGKDIRAEVSTLVPHPSKAHVCTFANDKRQKKGQLIVWK